jgi:hypothetical protein
MRIDKDLRRFRVLAGPFRVKGRTLQPGGLFTGFEAIGGKADIDDWMKRGVIELVPEGEQSALIIPAREQSVEDKQSVEIDRLSEELTDALVKIEGQKAELEKLTYLLDKKGAKAIKDENDVLRAEIEMLNAEIKTMKDAVVELDTEDCVQ